MVFDSVGLLCKLWSVDIGITDSLWMWIRAYLTDIDINVFLSTTPFHVLPAISGVPQGNILGPPLFLLHLQWFC